MSRPLPIRATSLHAGYGMADILRDVSIEAAAGRITTIAGPNGAGKSTLMKALVGLIAPRSGEVFIADRNVTKLAPSARAAAGLAYVPQEFNVFRNLTISENLKISFEFTAGRAAGPAYRSALDRVLTLFPDLSTRMEGLAGTLSGGQRQMLALGCALMPSPSALLLDEPSAGLSPLYVGSLLETVRQVNRTGVTILMIEQNLVEAMKITDDVVLLTGGNVRGRYEARSFLTNPTVRALFLGGGALAHEPEAADGASAA